MEYETYIVRPGNTLYAIAQFFSTTVDTLASLNGIKPPYTIYPGQVLKIPPFNESPLKYYVVRPGDTMASIARRYGVDLDDLIEFNNVENPNIIYPGQVLRLRR